MVEVDLQHELMLLVNASGSSLLPSLKLLTDGVLNAPTMLLTGWKYHLLHEHVIYLDLNAIMKISSMANDYDLWIESLQVN